MTDSYTFAKRVAIAAFVVVLVAGGFYLLITQFYFFLLVFAGILLAVLFCGMADWITDKLHLNRGWSLLLSVLIFFGLLVGAFLWVGPTVAEQGQEIRDTLPQSLQEVDQWLGQYSWGEKIAEKLPEDLSKILPKQSSLLSKVTGAVTTTLGILADLLIVVITSLFFASNPKLYTIGFTKLFPPRHRSRVIAVLGKCYHTLKLWLVAMLSAMAIIGISSAIGYSLIGLPMAFALALIAFLLAFIPNIGPWLAGVPAVLIGLTQGSQMALYVILVYGGIQMIETYAITPIIFQKTVALPPALLLFFQVLLGLVQGTLGLLLAAPILAVLIVVVKELYVKDVLEDETNTQQYNSDSPSKSGIS
ncbi:AI-2E family transporter [Pontibacter sp. BT310]|uniref:AI-2E family transporter n=1 Tax=Pontibacter populi TaxID=890055 RepID=A0ABS6XF44_9BACT|nr:MULTISPECIES: AI-2E family transporter [Pontibacter]MBJ6118971.1 AI-2E family transporter [Pontibacter sp. BT310]MBR0571399.1 AI-2E family transporter [Microvirga sp. STS03]MBW3365825.1 AI-2E family transporter [Pontibacter populi]